jgi:hypothetical protein
VEACRHLTATRWVFRHASQLARFWQVALGWRIRPYDQAEVTRLAAQGLTPESDPMVAIDSPDGSLVFFLQQVPEPKTVKNRMHVDARLRDEAHLEELLRLGATVESAQDGWQVLADPEGNEFCATRTSTGSPGYETRIR